MEAIAADNSAPFSTPGARSLKIEATGDFWKGIRLPKIRLMGRWLERAGFPPGARVQVHCMSPGVIELRIPANVTAANNDHAPKQLPLNF